MTKCWRISSNKSTISMQWISTLIQQELLVCKLRTMAKIGSSRIKLITSRLFLSIISTKKENRLTWRSEVKIWNLTSIYSQGSPFFAVVWFPLQVCVRRIRPAFKWVILKLVNAKAHLIRENNGTLLQKIAFLNLRQLLAYLNRSQVYLLLHQIQYKQTITPYHFQIQLLRSNKMQ